MSVWCDAHHVTKEQLKYWLSKFKVVPSEVVTTPTHWVPLTVADPVQFTNHASLVVYIGPAHIEIRSGFNPRLLREVMQALKRHANTLSGVQHVLRLVSNVN
jgi:hypothetical protein